MSCQKNYNNLLQQNKKLSTQIQQIKQNTKKNNNINNNLDKFNSMIDKATAVISCGPECQRQKKDEELEQAYFNAQTNLATAPNNLYVSRQNYVVFDQGQEAYDELIDSELLQQAEQLTSYFQTNFTNESQNINFNINTYSGLLINLKNIFDLYLKYKQENIDLFKQLKEETNDLLTNDRKTYYQDQGIDNLKFYYHYFLLFIYVIVVLIYVVYNFMYPSQLSILVRIIILVVMVLLPFISTFILGKIIGFIYQIYNWLPKNAHKQLSK
jgi:hypothetical protein